MCIRDSDYGVQWVGRAEWPKMRIASSRHQAEPRRGGNAYTCLLYTSDAADERSSVDLGGRRIIKKKNKE